MGAEVVKIYVVARGYGSDSPGYGDEKYGPPSVAFTDPDKAAAYVSASGLTVTEVDLR